jgi:outer membrane protein assembly factor BamE (lipoprotein component of BamABCDE complex)
MKLIALVSILTATLLFAGCISHEIKSATAPISLSRSELVVDGETTKTDIIAMFGEPNGFLPSADSPGVYNPNYILGNYHSNLLHYKDCVTGETFKFGLVFGTGKYREKCSVFTALLNKNNIVIGHAYIADNLVTKEKLENITAKKSTRKDVIQTLGGPSSITEDGNSEIYSYRNCVTTTKTSGFAIKRHSNKDCQLASIVFNKDKDIVQKVSYFPFLTTENPKTK